MKSRLSLFLAAIMVMSLFVFVGCGSGSGGSAGKEPEPFTLGKYTYKLDTVKKSPEGYDVTILIEGDSAPVIISNGATQSGVEAELKAGDQSYHYNEVGFSILAEDEKVGDFGARAEFHFTVPEEDGKPDTLVVTGGSNSSESKEIDLSGVEIEE